MEYAVLPAAAAALGFFTALVGVWAGLAAGFVLTLGFGSVLVPAGTPAEDILKSAPTDFATTFTLLAVAGVGFLVGSLIKPDG